MECERFAHLGKTPAKTKRLLDRDAFDPRD